MDFKAVDLFCGAGGMSEGLRNKFKILCSVEFDPVIAQTYKSNHDPDHVLVEDIIRITKKRWFQEVNLQPGELDLLIGTPPCQGFSKHSRKKTKENNDNRNKLIFHVHRVAQYFHPKYILFENVANIINFDYFYLFLRKLANLDEEGNPKIQSKPSYHIRFEVVDAKDYNVPQRRKRLILLAKRIEKHEFPNKGAIITLTKKGIPEVTAPLELWPQKNPAQKLGDYLSQFNLKPLEAGETDSEDSLHTTRNLSTTNLKRIEATSKNGGSRDKWPEELWLECHKKSKVGFGDVYGRMSFDGYAPTMTTGCNVLSKGRFGHPEQNRAISLREAALIQTFPLLYKFHGAKDNIAKQIGNAVPVNLARAFVDVIYQDLLQDK